MVSDLLSKREKQVFLHLVEDARLSDQEIARKIQTSRPTVSRIRQRLEKQGYIKGYIPRVNFDKLNLSVRSFLLFRWKDFSKKQELQQFDSTIKKIPSVTAYLKGEGFNGRTNIIVSLHEHLEDHARFIELLRETWADNVDGVEVFLSSTSATSKYHDASDIIKHVLSKQVDERKD
jgi:DNA-binding Lrp family transcriptional regulator